MANAYPTVALRTPPAGAQATDTSMPIPAVASQKHQGFAIIELEYEMTYAEAIDGPIGRTTGSPLGERICRQITSATRHSAQTKPPQSLSRTASRPRGRSTRRISISAATGWV